jgi:hypothetical protein
MSNGIGATSSDYRFQRCEMDDSLGKNTIADDTIYAQQLQQQC